MKFKAGDRVKVKDTSSPWKGETGVVFDDNYGKEFPYEVRFAENGDWQLFGEGDLEKTGRGRPTKEKPVKYIAIYDENDVDPVKKFTSKKELTEWIKEAQDDEDIDFDSIEVFEVNKELEIEVKTRVSLK